MTRREKIPPAIRTGPFTTTDARGHGVSPGRLRAHDLDRRFRGIRLHAAAPPTLEALCRARALTFPSKAFISGVTAAVLRGVPLARILEQSLTIHVTVPEGHRAIGGHGVIGHAARITENDVTTWRGLPLASPGRMWCELGATLALPDLVAAGDFLVNRSRRMVTVAALEFAFEAYPARRGTRRLRRALDLLDDNTASRKESHLRVLAVDHGLPAHVMNMRIRASSGHIYYGDLVFPRERVILEYQSGYHLDPDQQRADMTRRSRLEADGWMVVFVNADDLGDPRELAARIRTAIALHSRRMAGAAWA